MTLNTLPAAIIYDFDGTLAPGNMQDRQFIPDIGMEVPDFWKEVDDLTQREQMDQILSYMYTMLHKTKQLGRAVRREELTQKGRQTSFFPGVETWFDRINRHAAALNLHVDHYLISSGNSEIIEGTSIARHFARIYASKFLYDAEGNAVWPALAINFTTKTQYLFRINKNAHDLTDDTRINQYVPRAQRSVPFERMIYIGDGETDAPCFSLVKDLGGLAIAVHPEGVNHRNRVERFRREGRVNAVAPCDYRQGSKLDRTVRAYLEILQR